MPTLAITSIMVVMKSTIHHVHFLYSDGSTRYTDEHPANLASTLDITEWAALQRAYRSQNQWVEVK